MSDKPYKYLMGIKNFCDNLEFFQEEMRITANAVEVGLKESKFKALWKGYQTDTAKKEGVYSDNYIDIENGERLYTDDWICDDSGVYTFNPQKGGKIFACLHPIYITKRLYNVDLDEERIEICFKRGNEWQKRTIPKTMITSASKIVELSKFGVGVTSENAKNLVSYFNKMEMINDQFNRASPSTERLGWVDGYGFSPYTEELLLDCGDKYGNLYKSITSKGTLIGWIETTKKLRKDSTIAQIVLASSFASVLMHPFKILPFFVHLWGGSGNGKTVTQCLAASVWGIPERSKYVQSFNGTAVSQEKNATFLNSLPFIVDELQIKNSTMQRPDFDNMIYTLCEGQGKGRGTKNGGLERTGYWANIIISSGEGTITSSESAGGALNRVFEIACNGTKCLENPVKAFKDMQKNYGHAGKAFVEKLLTKDENGKLFELINAQNIYNEFFDELKKTKTEKQACAGAVILTADKLISEWFFEDEPLQISDIEQLLRSADEVCQEKRIYEYLCEVVSVNYNNFQNDNYTESVKGECYGRIKDDYVYYIPTIFNRLVEEKSGNVKAVLTYLGSNNLIKQNHGKKYITKINGRAMQSYAIKLPDEPVDDMSEVPEDEIF